MAVTNSDIGTLRRQLKKARDHIHAEEWHKARATLNGLEHPLADRLRAEVTIHFASQPPKPFPVTPLIAILIVEAILLVAVAYGGWRWSVMPSSQPLILPTLATLPHADCTPATVEAWWAHQREEVAQFVQDASCASRTLPGAQLDQRLARLHEARATFTSPPVCASLDFRWEVSEVWRAMDDILLGLEAWSTGTLDDLGVQAIIRTASRTLLTP